MNTTQTTRTGRIIGWFGVLAGAYRGGQMERRTVCHAATADADGSNAFQGNALCGYKSERLCDIPAETTEEKCPRCLAKAEKLGAK